MAFVYHDHEGFRPSKRSRKQGRQPLSVRELVLRTTEEMTANEDWLSECRSRSSHQHLKELGFLRSFTHSSRFDSRLRGTGNLLQVDVSRSGESVRTAERPDSIGVPSTRVAKCFESRESTFNIQSSSCLVKGCGFFDSNEQAGDCVTIFDPIFTPSDATYLKDYAGYVVLSVRIEGEGHHSMIFSNSFLIVDRVCLPG